MRIVNAAAYKFVAILDRNELQPVLLQRCIDLDLKGTILLSDEGINFNLAGSEDSIEAFLSYLKSDALFSDRFTDLEIKHSVSETQPFKKMVVRMPKEIITMRHPMIRPEASRAAAVEPEKLKKWLDQGHDDDGREVVLLDTRNTYEMNVGTFENAIDPKIEFFSQFPEAIQTLVNDKEKNFADKMIVTFCTGGIRCEKAALYMNELNLPHVVQLHGGILNYFEKVGSDHWQGECFVFDERVAVDTNLQPTTTDYGKQAAKTYRSKNQGDELSL